MAICSACKHDMQVTDGCVEVLIEIKRGRSTDYLKPIPYGQEQRYGEDWQCRAHNQRCHDCNVKPGQFHHPGCDIEECPNCHHQMLMCGGDCGTLN